MKDLTICKCPIHGMWSISLDNNSDTGLRITPYKCCGRWTDIKRFPISAEQLRSIAEELECAAEDVEHEGEDTKP